MGDGNSGNASGGNSGNASGGNSGNASGGNSGNASGGNSGNASGGNSGNASGGGPRGTAPIASVKKEIRELPGGGRAVIYEARDSARLEPEVALPHREDYIPNVEILGRRTWDDVASVLEDRTIGLARRSPELERAAAEAAGDAKDPIGKARAIHRWVNDLVAEPSGPSRAVEVLVTRSGDRTVLFKALLDIAGVPCRWAFVRPKETLLPADDGSHPRPDAFGSRLVLVDPDGPRPAWVSLGVRRSPFGKLPPAFQGGTALVLETGGGARFAPIPSEPLEESANGMDAELVLSGPGIPELAARAKVEIAARAVDDYAMKDRVRTLQDNLKRQVLSASAGKLFPGARLIDGSFPGLDDPDKSFTILFEVEAPRAVARGEKGELLLRPVLQPLSLVERLIRRPNREHPYRLPGQIVMRDRISIDTGPGIRVDRLPAGTAQTSRLGSYSLLYRRAGPDGKGGEKIVVEREVTLLPVTVGTDGFPRIVEFCRAADRAEGERIVLRPNK